MPSRAKTTRVGGKSRRRARAMPSRTTALMGRSHARFPCTPLLAEEHGEEREVSRQRGDLVADDATEGVVRGSPLRDDLAQPGPVRADGLLEAQAAAGLLARPA